MVMRRTVKPANPKPQDADLTQNTVEDEDIEIVEEQAQDAPQGVVLDVDEEGEDAVVLLNTTEAKKAEPPVIVEDDPSTWPQDFQPVQEPDRQVDPDFGEQERQDPNPQEPRTTMLEADDPILMFVGPMRSYTSGDLKFQLNEIKPVPKRYARELLMTGYFRRSTREAMAEVHEVERVAKESKAYPVGRFDSKEAAIAYAQTVHNIQLNSNTSLRQLNEMTVRLNEMAVRTAAMSGIEEVG